jgi:hypothetical protein
MWTAQKHHQEVVEISTKANEITINAYNIA